MPMSAPRAGSRRGASGELDVSRDGRRIDLLVDGISYSTWHPDQPWSGYVWDALAATVLLRAWTAPRVLLLGAGAGTVLLLVKRLRPDARLLAVERDARVLRVARERFGLGEIDAEIVEDDGLEFLARTRRRFDLVIDDMFSPGRKGLERPVADEAAHLARIAARLDTRGVAATNSTTDGDPPDLERALGEAHRGTFAHRVRLAPRLGWNVVLAGSDAPLDPKALREKAASLLPLDRAGLEAVRVRTA
jgi:spermidine synthase